MNTRERVIVGMSGGVDSSVTAALMKDQGHQVSGLFMKNWEEDDKGECNSKNDYNDAKRVCKKLNIKLFSINFSDIYWDLVFKKFLSKLKSGVTPNPDILCNKEIKFNYFLKYGLSLGFDKVATGHYAKLKKEKNFMTLGIPKDKQKDQTYFLHAINPAILSKVIYPGSKTHPQFQLVQKQMLQAGSIVTFVIKGGKEKAFKFMNALEVFDISNNLGDTKSLATHPATTTHRVIGEEGRKRLNIDDGMIRLSIGLEDIQDLVEDIDQALAKVN